MIYYLLLLTIYIWPFGQLLSFPQSPFPFTIYLLDISLLFILIALILSRQRKKIFSGSILKSLMIFFGIVIFSLLLNINRVSWSEIPSSVFYLLRIIIYPSLFFAVRYIGIERLKKPLNISLIIFCFLCIVQYILIPDMRFLKNIGFDDHYFRLIGPFFDPNFTGAVFAAASLYFIGNNKISYSLPFIGLLAPTVSRASYLVFVAGLIYILFHNKKIKLLILIGVLGAIILMIPKPFGEGINLFRTFSIYSRLDSWRQGISLFFDKPIFGWGYNTLRNNDGSRFQIDNSYIFLLATTGIAGLLSFSNLLKDLLKNIKNVGIKILIFSLLIHSLFNNSLFYIWILAVFWFMSAIGWKSPKEYKQLSK